MSIPGIKYLDNGIGEPVRQIYAKAGDLDPTLRADIHPGTPDGFVDISDLAMIAGASAHRQ